MTLEARAEGPAPRLSVYDASRSGTSRKPARAWRNSGPGALDIIAGNRDLIQQIKGSGRNSR